MRWIDLSNYSPNEEWLNDAKAVTEELMNAKSSKERNDIIKKNESLWGKLKAELVKQFYGKCWYSEAKELVSDYHVDHFRPKNNVKNFETKKDERDGYWWLAFDWRNYRISGSICNSPHKREDQGISGKWDYFPLKEGSPVASSPKHDLNDELIYLLDPTDPDDPALLTFDESGFPRAASKDGTWEYERAYVTIKLLHLDYRPLVDERIVIWNECNRLINNAANEMENFKDVPSVTSKSRIKDIFRTLRNMVHPSAELSSTARACLLNSEYEWAKNIAS
jgi:uncharacterized protein (TIGR02646 family)